MHHPRRFFRSSLLTAGALLSGAALALPAAASADAPSYPAKFAAGVAATDHGIGARGVRLFHGLPTREPGFVTVDVDDDDQLRFTAFLADGKGSAAEDLRASAGTIEQVLFTGTGNLAPKFPSATAIAVVARVSSSQWKLVVYGTNGADYISELTLGGRPTGLAVGRFVPGATTDEVAVSFASGETRVYGAEAPDLELVQHAAWGDLAGPLTSWRTDGGTQDALGATRNGVAVSARGLNGNAVDATPDATIPSLDDLQQRGSQDLDPLGRRWATHSSSTSPSDGFGYSRLGGRENAFTQSILQLDRALVAHFGRPGAPDTIGAVGPSGTLFRAPDGEESYVPFGGADGTMVDLDGDTRDDLVLTTTDTATARTTVTVHRNVTGDEETRAKLTAKQFATPLTQDDYGTWSTTKTNVSWQVPTDGASYRCAVDGGPAPSFVPCTQAFEMPGLTLGRHELQVERREQGLTFWAPATTFTFYVRPSAPAFVGTPPTTTNTPSVQVEPRPGAALQCRTNPRLDRLQARSAPGWVDCDTPYGEDLSEGPHTVDFRWVDLASDVPSDITRWTVDVDRTAPAALEIAARPDERTTSTTAVVEYTAADDVASVECAIDGGPYVACVGPVRLTDLQPGRHVVKLRATDLAGNAAQPTVVEWEVVAKETPGDTSEPTGPQSGDAPAQAVVTPKPVPATSTPAAAAPAAASKPAPVAPRPELKAPKAPVKTPSATVTGRALNVGCAVPGATSYRCEITVSKEGKRLGHAVRRGDGTVQVKLTREGARKVQRLGGLNVRVKVRATADGKTTTTVKTVRILPTKVLVVPTDGLFAFDSAKPSAAGVRLASTIASQLFGAREITIVGHTDSKGRDAVNERLGLQRARAFAALLRSEGLGGTRVVVESAGEGSPRASNDTERGQQLNRRVEVTVRY